MTPVSYGKPCAGNPHARFDEGAGVPDNKGRSALLYTLFAPFRSKADFRLDIPDKVGIGLGKGSERTAKRILELLVDGPMRPSALREAVGIKSPIHFSRYYLRPLMEKGMIERTDPDSPKSPRQEYKLA